MNSTLRSGLILLAAVITIVLAAQATIGIGGIPITGQTLVILCWAFFLSTRESILVLAAYLILGFSGAPIFADGAHGLDLLYGGSGGYLIGFLIAAGGVSYLYQKQNSDTFQSIFSLTAFGTAVILLFGVGRLMTLYGFQKGIEYGFAPFWKGALIKILVGSIIVWAIKKYSKSKVRN